MFHTSINQPTTCIFWDKTLEQWSFDDFQLHFIFQYGRTVMSVIWLRNELQVPQICMNEKLYVQNGVFTMRWKFVLYCVCRYIQLYVHSVENMGSLRKLPYEWRQWLNIDFRKNFIQRCYLLYIGMNLFADLNY